MEVVVVVAVVAAVCVERVGLVGFEVVVAVLAREIAVGGGCCCCCTAAIFVSCLVFVSLTWFKLRQRPACALFGGYSRCLYFSKSW